MIINAQIRKSAICSTTFAEGGGQYYCPSHTNSLQFALYFSFFAH